MPVQNGVFKNVNIFLPDEAINLLIVTLIAEYSSCKKHVLIWYIG